MQAMRFNFCPVPQRGGTRRSNATAFCWTRSARTTASRPCRNSASNGRHNWPAAPPTHPQSGDARRPARTATGGGRLDPATDIRLQRDQPNPGNHRQRPRRPDGAGCVGGVFQPQAGGQDHHVAALRPVSGAQGYWCCWWTPTHRPPPPARSALFPISICKMATICSSLTEALDRLSPAVKHPLGHADLIRRDWRCNTATGSCPNGAPNEALGPPPFAAASGAEDGRGPLRHHRGGHLPSLGMLALNAIAAANLIVMPIVPHMYDISSSVQYFRILEQICALYERKSTCRGSISC